MRPNGLSRQATRDMVALVRWQLGCDYAIVSFADPDQCEDREYVAGGHQSSPHEEGWSARTVEVRTTDASGVYAVTVVDTGRDCDGSHSSSSETLCARRQKAQRFYLSRDWKRNRPEGRFEVRRWRVLESKDGPVYDQFAQAAGY